MSIAPAEFTAADDLYRNYCLWPYTPVAPGTGKLRPINLLFNSFELAGLGERAVWLVRAIQRAIGPFQTVWGTKLINGKLGWEFYFYDYARRERAVSASRVLQALRPFAGSTVTIDEQLPYFMFSLDITPELLDGRSLDLVHIYVGHPSPGVSSGIAYGVTSKETRLENFYFFFDAQKDLAGVVQKVFASARLPANVPMDALLWPELRDCQTICVANKQLTDTIYFSGITVAQLLIFLQRLGYPEKLVSYIQDHQDKLDHLLYDVGYDYTVTPDGQIQILKSGYYNIF